MNSILKNKKGFTLTEVMIGMMILTVAIVSATQLLIGVMNSNKAIMHNMQAYYLAQEGIEAIRNIRDTNWLHNKDWLGSDDGNWIWGNAVDGSEQVVSIESRAWTSPPPSSEISYRDLENLAPWSIDDNGDGIIYRGDGYLSGRASGDDTGFKRMVSVKDYREDCDSNGDQDECENYVLVTSKVTWDNGDQELVLDTVLTDWKGGAL